MEYDFEGKQQIPPPPGAPPPGVGQQRKAMQQLFNLSNSCKLGLLSSMKRIEILTSILFSLIFFVSYADPTYEFHPRREQFLMMMHTMPFFALQIGLLLTAVSNVIHGHSGYWESLGVVGHGVLPNGWLEYLDEVWGRPYYYNVHTKVTTWYKPTGAVPPPPPAEGGEGGEGGGGGLMVNFECTLETHSVAMTGFI